jgi:hypothetical protein
MAGTVFWLLVAGFVVLFIWGLMSKSRKLLIISGLAITLPSLYFLGAENGFRLLALVPLLPFGFSYFFAKQKKNSR